jgi:hypothetical protein
MNNETLTYEEWMEAVDRLLVYAIGLDQQSLADWLSRDAYDAGTEVLDAARECLIEQDMLSEIEIDELLGA